MDGLLIEATAKRPSIIYLNWGKHKTTLVVSHARLVVLLTYGRRYASSNVVYTFF